MNDEQKIGQQIFRLLHSGPEFLLAGLVETKSPSDRPKCHHRVYGVMGKLSVHAGGAVGGGGGSTCLRRVFGFECPAWVQAFRLFLCFRALPLWHDIFTS